MRQLEFELQRFDDIYGTNGDDTISNDIASIAIYAGEGNDTVTNSREYVTISGDDGNDHITNTNNHVRIIGGAGNDYIYTSGGYSGGSIYLGLYNYVYGGDGDDTIMGYVLWSYIYGGDGNDLISIKTKDFDADIIPGKGDDTVYKDGSYKRYWYASGDGNDIIYGVSDKDTLIITGGEYSTTKSGTDLIVNVDDGSINFKGAAFSGLNIVGNMKGSKNISSSDSNTVLNGGDANDTVENTGGRVQIYAGDGSDSVSSSGDYVTVEAGSGKDTISSSGDYVVINAGADNDSISSNGYSMSIFGGAGNDSINVGWNSSKNSSRSVINGDEGNDYISNYSSSLATIDGGSGADTISNSGSYSSVKGGTGNDSIYNYASNVTINGGADNDIISIHSSSDNNLIQYELGDGNDTILGFGIGHTLQIATSDYTTAKNGNDLILYIANSSVILKDAADIVSEVNGTIAGDRHKIITGTSSADSLANSIKGAIVYGLDSGDSITNSAGKVSIDGGYGNDYVNNSGYSVTINGGSDNDSIQNSGTTAEIYGEAGDDSIKNTGTGSTIYGGTGNDTIENSSSLSGIYGGEGDDTIKTAGTNSTVYGGDGDDYISNDSGYATLNGNGGADTIQNGSSNVNISGGDGNDYIRGLSSSIEKVTIDAGNGNDTIKTWGKYVTVDGGDGDDSISNNCILRGAGDYVSIKGGRGDDFIRNWHDHVTIVGGKNNDTIENSGKYNLYQYTSGDGNDVITGLGSNDTLQIISSSYDAEADGSDLIITVGKSSIRVKDGVSVALNIDHIYSNDEDDDNTLPAGLSLNSGVLSIGSAFGGNSLRASEYDAAKVDATALERGLKIYGSNPAECISGGSGNDTIYGGNGADTIFGNAGGDYLNGGNGNDVLYGGAGRNTLTGSNGRDVFVYDGGNDLITDYRAGYDKIKLASGTITRSSLSGSNVILTVGSGKITVRGGRGREISVIDASGNETTRKYSNAVYGSSALLADDNFVGGNTLDEITAEKFTVTEIETPSADTLARETLITYAGD
ncbi:MAG: hypothetical protein J5809_01470 [Selenomonadaceae bacterium]|nr:hypothetical protein [Selenomonadaceae bacterium]